MFPVSPGSSSSGNGRSSVRDFSLNQINDSFSTMSALKPLAARGRGSIAVILPKTRTAPHFQTSDRLDLATSFQQAGLRAAQYTVQVLPDNRQLSAAETAIAKGASVLIVDTRGSADNVRIESYARARSVPVIDYDWLTPDGSREYYVGFDSLKVGVLLGLGLVHCVSAWHIKHPQILVMRGAPTDYNSALYAEGYDAVLQRQPASGWKKINVLAGTWDPKVALSEFQRQYSDNPGINAALIPNDENAAPIIGYLRSKGIKAQTFPTTGLDATPGGLQNVRAGYQCGTVYKPIYLEAQAAAALAIYLRARVTLPTSLLNWKITDPQTHASVASVLLTPEWVTAENINP
jgi:D-xylose transport system substrate-binding protein